MGHRRQQCDKKAGEQDRILAQKCRGDICFPTYFLQAGKHIFIWLREAIEGFDKDIQVNKTSNNKTPQIITSLCGESATYWTVVDVI